MYRRYVRINASKNVVVTAEEHSKAIKLERQINNQIYSLESLLGFDLSKSGKKFITIRNRILSVVSAYMNQNYEQGGIEMGLLHALTEELTFLKLNNKIIYRKLKKEIKRAATDSNYYSVRFEVYTAFNLAKNGFEVVKRESPDFTFRIDNSWFFIECTTTRISSGISTNYVYKVESAVKKKSSKGYANKDTILFIDTTNVMHHQSVHGFKTTGRIFRDVLNDYSKRNLFGGIALFTRYFNPINGDHAVGYDYVFSEQASPLLRTAMSKMFPIENDTHDVQPVEFEEMVWMKNW